MPFCCLAFGGVGTRFFGKEGEGTIFKLSLEQSSNSWTDRKPEMLIKICMCIRDASGSFLQARTIKRAFLPSVHEGEALTLLEAIKWLKDLDVEQVLIEMGNLRVVQGLKDSTEFGSILLSCRSLLDNIPNFQINFVRRQENIVAHSRASMDYACFQVFFYVPSCIAGHIMNEMA